MPLESCPFWNMLHQMVLGHRRQCYHSHRHNKTQSVEECHTAIVEPYMLNYQTAKGCNGAASHRIPLGDCKDPVRNALGMIAILERRGVSTHPSMVSLDTGQMLPMREELSLNDPYASCPVSCSPHLHCNPMIAARYS